MAEGEPSEKFQLYHYDPSLAAAAISAILFLITTLAHIWQMFKHKTWFFVAFIFGGLCKKSSPPFLLVTMLVPNMRQMLIASQVEVVGYTGRTSSANEAPDFTLVPYITQSLLLLLGPSFFAASIYMILGRIIRLTGGERHSPIRPTRLTKIFVLGDVLSFFVQSGGEWFARDCSSLASQLTSSQVAAC
jgi:hypothetical protein